MNKLLFFSFDCIGYDQYYEKILPEIEAIVEKNASDSDSDGYIIIALNEAVCNAAKYALDGAENVEIHIDITVNEDDIRLNIKAATEHWNAEEYRNQLKKLSDDEYWGDKDWGDYTNNSNKSRGIWLMLTGCEYMYFSSYGQDVTLFFSTHTKTKKVTYNIRDLVHRFFIQNEDGVIY